MDQKPKLNFFLWWPVIIIAMAFWPIGVTLLLIRIYKDKTTALRVGQVLKVVSYIFFGILGLVFIGILFGGNTSEGDLPIISFLALLVSALYIISRILISNANKVKKYMNAIVNHQERDIDNIARMLNIPNDKVTKDITKLIDQGYFKGAIIDHSARRIRLPQDRVHVQNNQGNTRVQTNYSVTSNVSSNVDSATLNRIFDKMSAAMDQVGNLSAQSQQAAAQQSAQQQAPQPRVTQCKYCGANNSVENHTGECEYCGSPL